ncbi:tetratricopeptide repeat protein [Acidobacteriota bacterium]
MKSSIKIISIAILLFFLFSHFAFLNAQSGGIEGFIEDADTAGPINKVKVIITNTKTSTLKYVVYSDEKGHFYKGGLRVGNYKIAVEMEGYYPTASSIRVQRGDAARFQVKLKSLQGYVAQSGKASDQGLNLIEAGKYEEAVLKFTEIIETDSSNATLFYYRGLAFEKNGQTDKALEDYQKAVELNPAFLLPISSIGNIFAKQKDPEKAVEFYKKALELGETDTTIHYNYGVSLMNLGNHAEAKSVLEGLLAVDGSYSDALYQLGIIYITLGDAATAREYLEKFIDLDPDNPNAAIANEILKSLY